MVMPVFARHMEWPHLVRHTLLALVFAGWVSPGLRGATAVSPNHPVPGGLPGYLVLPLGRGHFNRLCFAATLEGVQGLMILDTGAAHSGLSASKYAFIKPGPNRPLPSKMPATVYVNGRSAPVGFAHNFLVHNTDLGANVFPLLPQHDLYDASLSNRQYDGLFGEDYLRHFRAVVDCGRLVAYFNLDPARKTNLGPALTRAGWTAVPMHDLHNNFVVPCEINGHRFRMIVDTGAPFVAMDVRMLLTAGVSGRSTHLRSGVIGTHVGETQFARVPQVSFGQYQATDVQVFTNSNNARYFQDTANDVASGKVLGLLGGDFLANHHAIIDVGGSTLYLRSTAPPH